MNKRVFLSRPLSPACGRSFPSAASTLMALVLPVKDPAVDPYEMIAMTPKERYRYQKEYKEANRELLRKALYELTFLILPWRLRRRRRRVFYWIRRGRHFERFRQHRLRRRRRQEMRLSTPNEKCNSSHCFAKQIIRNFRKFLRKILRFCLCNPS